MFIRFESTLPDPHSGRPIGVFQASRIVCDEPNTPAYLIDLIQEQRLWFNSNLQRPARLNNSKKPHAREVAVCWFLPTALEHIERARILSALVSEQTFAIAMKTTRKPGIIIYRDEIQVAAVPFRR